MELDDFRSRWQEQPVATDTPSQTEQTLRTMLTLKSNSPLNKMQGNARRDFILLLVPIIINMNTILNFKHNYLLGVPKEVCFLILGVAMVLPTWIGFRRLQLIRKLGQDAAPTSTHVTGLVQQLRSLMDSSWYAGVLFVGLIGLALLVGNSNILLERLQNGRVDWGLTILVIFAIAVFLSVMIAISIQREQNRYGKYLDQLEGALRELRG